MSINKIWLFFMRKHEQLLMFYYDFSRGSYSVSTSLCECHRMAFKFARLLWCHRQCPNWICVRKLKAHHHSSIIQMPLCRMVYSSRVMANGDHRVRPSLAVTVCLSVCMSGTTILHTSAQSYRNVVWLCEPEHGFVRLCGYAPLLFRSFAVGCCWIVYVYESALPFDLLFWLCELKARSATKEFNKHTN